MRGGKKNKGPGIGREINMKQRHCLASPQCREPRGIVVGELEGSKITADNDFLITRLVGGDPPTRHGRGGGGNGGGIGYAASTARSFPFPTI